MDYDAGLETKVMGGDQAEALMRAFEAFKEANDERLLAIEKKMSADVLIENKVERIGRALDEIMLKEKRPRMAGPEPQQVSEHRKAFETYLRKGDNANLGAIEMKSMSAGSDPDGGYLVPDEIETEIGRLLKDSSPIRSIAGIRQVSASVYKKPFATTGAEAGWVGETASRSETDSPTLAELQFPAMELYAQPAATQALLDDAAVDLDKWIAEEVEFAFAEQETQAFISGNGTNKPRGFLDYTKVADGSWSWGNIGYLLTGVSAGFAASDPGDHLIDLVYALKAGYRQNASWVMNRRTQGAVRKLKDGEGNYLWQPAVTGGRASLLGYDIVEAEDMPDIAANSYAIAFGDFRRGYLIVDRLGVRVLRDPYSAKPYVLFYTTKRVGGGVQNFEAIKLLKFGTA